MQYDPVQFTQRASANGRRAVGILTVIGLTVLSLILVLAPPSGRAQEATALPQAEEKAKQTVLRSDYHKDARPDGFVPNNWIKLKLVGTTSNRSAIGATVRLRATILS